MIGVNYFEHYLDFCKKMWHNIKVMKITGKKCEDVCFTQEGDRTI